MTAEAANPFEGRVGYCVGTGRCGTTFLAEVAASHERERQDFVMQSAGMRVPGSLTSVVTEIRERLQSFLEW